MTFQCRLSTKGAVAALSFGSFVWGLLAPGAILGAHATTLHISTSPVDFFIEQLRSLIAVPIAQLSQWNSPAPPDAHAEFTRRLKQDVAATLNDQVATVLAPERPLKERSRAAQEILNSPFWPRAWQPSSGALMMPNCVDLEGPQCAGLREAPEETMATTGWLAGGLYSQRLAKILREQPELPRIWMYAADGSGEMEAVSISRQEWLGMVPEGISSDKLARILLAAEFPTDVPIIPRPPSSRPRPDQKVLHRRLYGVTNPPPNPPDKAPNPADRVWFHAGSTLPQEVLAGLKMSDPVAGNLDPHQILDAGSYSLNDYEAPDMAPNQFETLLGPVRGKALDLIGKGLSWVRMAPFGADVTGDPYILKSKVDVHSNFSSDIRRLPTSVSHYLDAANLSAALAEFPSALQNVMADEQLMLDLLPEGSPWEPYAALLRLSPSAVERWKTTLGKVAKKGQHRVLPPVSRLPTRGAHPTRGAYALLHPRRLVGTLLRQQMSTLEFVWTQVRFIVQMIGRSILSWMQLFTNVLNLGREMDPALGPAADFRRLWASIFPSIPLDVDTDIPSVEPSARPPGYRPHPADQLKDQRDAGIDVDEDLASPPPVTDEAGGFSTVNASWLLQKSPIIRYSRRTGMDTLWNLSAAVPPWMDQVPANWSDGLPSWLRASWTGAWGQSCALASSEIGASEICGIGLASREGLLQFSHSIVANSVRVRFNDWAALRGETDSARERLAHAKLILKAADIERGSLIGPQFRQLLRLWDSHGDQALQTSHIFSPAFTLEIDVAKLMGWSTSSGLSNSTDPPWQRLQTGDSRPENDDVSAAAGLDNWGEGSIDIFREARLIRGFVFKRFNVLKFEWRNVPAPEKGVPPKYIPRAGSAAMIQLEQLNLNYRSRLYDYDISATNEALDAVIQGPYSADYAGVPKTQLFLRLLEVAQYQSSQYATLADRYPSVVVNYGGTQKLTPHPHLDRYPELTSSDNDSLSLAYQKSQLRHFLARRGRLSAQRRLQQEGGFPLVPGEPAPRGFNFARNSYAAPDASLSGRLREALFQSKGSSYLARNGVVVNPDNRPMAQHLVIEAYDLPVEAPVLTLHMVHKHNMIVGYQTPEFAKVSYRADMHSSAEFLSLNKTQAAVKAITDKISQSPAMADVMKKIESRLKEARAATASEAAPKTPVGPSKGEQTDGAIKQGAASTAKKSHTQIDPPGITNALLETYEEHQLPRDPVEPGEVETQQAAALLTGTAARQRELAGELGSAPETELLDRQLHDLLESTLRDLAGNHERGEPVENVFREISVLAMFEDPETGEVLTQTVTVDLGNLLDQDTTARSVDELLASMGAEPNGIDVVPEAGGDFASFLELDNRVRDNHEGSDEIRLDEAGLPFRLDGDSVSPAEPRRGLDGGDLLREPGTPRIPEFESMWQQEFDAMLAEELQALSEESRNMEPDVDGMVAVEIATLDEYGEAAVETVKIPHDVLKDQTRLTEWLEKEGWLDAADSSGGLQNGSGNRRNLTLDVDDEDAMWTGNVEDGTAYLDPVTGEMFVE